MTEMSSHATQHILSHTQNQLQDDSSNYDGRTMCKDDAQKG